MTAYEVLEHIHQTSERIKASGGVSPFPANILAEVEGVIAQPRAYRIKVTWDPDGRFEECNGENRPLTEEEYRENYYRACLEHPRAGLHSGGSCRTCGKGVPTVGTIPYEEYLAYYGNPERHVYLGVILEKQCPCCGEWRNVGSLWSIDFMDNDSAYLEVKIDHYYTSADQLPGRLKNVAEELISEDQA